MRPSNHSSLADGIPDAKLQGSEASSRQNLQSQTRYRAENRFSISGLAVVHGRLTNQLVPEDELIVVRGTYRQKIGGFNLYDLKSDDTHGGVFEGTYNLTARRLDKLHFKISIRTG